MILHHLPRYTSQLRTQFARRTCIFKLYWHQGARAFSYGPVNEIELDFVYDSTITGVSVYPSRAEITRLFKLDIETGRNQLNISGLPVALDKDSLRVEGRGAATIQGVTFSDRDIDHAPPSGFTTPDKLKKLIDKMRSIQKETVECLNTKIENLEYFREEDGKKTQAEDETISDLEDELADTEEAITVEVEKFSRRNAKLNPNFPKISIDVFSDFEGKISIALIYAVHSVKWNAGYDIRVDTKKKDKPVTLTYKAGITQATGENWDDVPLTLETTTPTFGLKVPALSPWNIPFYHQLPMKSKHLTVDDAPDQQEHVSSTGNVNATFQVPGLISIPCDGIIHNATIAKLDLDAKMSWVCVPKKGAKTYLNAKIKNSSPYTFLSGQSSVNVDGSIISKSDVPLVSPEESFDCPLDVDPSIRVIYHPRSEKLSQSSGIFTKTTKHLFSQRITIANTKTLPIENLKIIDQVPVSENPKITVKLVNPALSVPEQGFGWGSSVSTANREFRVPPPVSVASGVVAQWHGADEAGVEVEALGKDGKLDWVCAVPAQEQIRLVLQWEVVALSCD